MSTQSWRPGGPGSFLAPDGVRTVRDRAGWVWVRDATRWTADGRHYVRWRMLLDEHGPVTQIDNS